MQAVNDHFVKLDPSLVREDYKRRRAKKRVKFMHRMLGGKCMDCSVLSTKAVMNVHHIFYDFGYTVFWSKRWRYATEDSFWNIFFPEIMEACILLCRKCHKKRHGRR